jgi:hypothetical protein
MFSVNRMLGYGKEQDRGDEHKIEDCHVHVSDKTKCNHGVTG